MKEIKKVNLKDLTASMTRAKEAFHSMPGNAQLTGMIRPLTQPERLALCYLDAALLVINTMGVDTSGIIIEYGQPDNESIE